MNHFRSKGAQADLPLPLTYQGKKTTSLRTLRKFTLVSHAVLAGLALSVPAARAAEAPAQTGDEQLNPVFVQVTLEGQPIADVINAYELGDDVLVPMGELARLLTIGVTIDPAGKVASGFLVEEGKPFRLDLEQGTVTTPSGKAEFDRSKVRWIDGDLYVTRALLQSWWPIGLDLDMSSLQLDVRPRIKLPVQLRMERERAAQNLVAGASRTNASDLVPLKSDYKWISLPTVDSTVSLEAREAAGNMGTNYAYSGYFAGDLMRMEMSGFLSVSRQDTDPKVRLALRRYNPEARLLGPLRARTFEVGDVEMPAVRDVFAGGGGGYGVLLSNRSASSGSSFGLQTLRGPLPPGWDVTLFVNEALVGFQVSRDDGIYEFKDLPLSYGRTEFRLVFNGPLGQSRVVRQNFQLDQTMAKAGEFTYSIGGKQEHDGGYRHFGIAELGVNDHVTATASIAHVRASSGEDAQTYVTAGVRAGLLGALVNLDRTFDFSGGSVTALGVRTEILSVSVDASHAWISNFSSDLVSSGPNAPRLRDSLNLTGSLSLSNEMRLPFAFSLKRDVSNSGASTYALQQRVSARILKANLTNSINWLRTNGTDKVDGTVQMSYRIAGLGISGLGQYRLVPGMRATSASLIIDKLAKDNSRFNLGALHSFETGATTLTGGVDWRLGSFAMGLSGTYSNSRNFGVGLVLFHSLGRDPRSDAIHGDWQPQARSGSLAARVFLDANDNGRFDPTEALVANAGFQVNGAVSPKSRTDAKGEAWLSQLAPRQYSEVVLDTGSLEDPSWQPVVTGVRFLPRPGKAARFDFPIVSVGDAEGTVRFTSDAGLRGIGNAEIELVDANGAVAGKTRSASDGYFIFEKVKPGHYSVRIAAEQLSRLGITSNGEVAFDMTSEKGFVGGLDLLVQAK